MAFPQPGNRAPDLRELPTDVCKRIADHLELEDIVRLAATCRALRAASAHHWFDFKLFRLDTDVPTPPERLKWLARVRARVALVVGDERVMAALSAGGARIQELSMPGARPGSPRRLPPELASLGELHTLSLISHHSTPGWAHVPRQLQRLNMRHCRFQELPAALAGLTQLTSVDLSETRIECGWAHLPRQLQRLVLFHCGIQQLPAPLAGLTQLSHLELTANGASDGTWGGLQHLPERVQELQLDSCRLGQVPRQVAQLTQLTRLSFAGSPIRGGWEHLPRQLVDLDLHNCGLQQIPEELSRLTRLSTLILSRNPVAGGWQNLPLRLGKLQLYDCGLEAAPAELAGRRVNVWM